MKMKFFAALMAFLLSAVTGENKDVCYNSIVGACTGDPPVAVECNSLMGGFRHVEHDLQSYVNDQLISSYDYLLLGTHFKSYQKNRPGFNKLFQELSDKAWNKAIELIKHITKRGGRADFNRKIDNSEETSTTQKKTLELNEMQALSMALDTEKKLAGTAHHIHRRVSHIDRYNHYDPEISQFVEEQFLEYQAVTIRRISGYANDLAQLIKSPNPSLPLYLFDEYLAKQ